MDPDSVYEYALRFLATRPRSAIEIRRRLRQRDVDEEIIDITIERLGRVGLVDDAAFTQFWIENRQRFNPRGQRALQAELRQKGVASDVIAEHLAHDVNESNDIRAAAQRQARYLHNVDEQTFRKRLWAHLARRGFDFELIGPAVTAAWEWIQDTSH